MHMQTLKNCVNPKCRYFEKYPEPYDHLVSGCTVLTPQLGMTELALENLQLLLEENCKRLLWISPRAAYRDRTHNNFIGLYNTHRQSKLIIQAYWLKARITKCAFLSACQYQKLVICLWRSSSNCQNTSGRSPCLRCWITKLTCMMKHNIKNAFVTRWQMLAAIR